MPEGHDRFSREGHLLPRTATAYDGYAEHNLIPDGRWEPITGWPLKTLGLIAIGSGVPQMLLYANRARPLWRQAVFLALALGVHQEPDRFLARVSDKREHGSDLRALAKLLPVLTPLQIVRGCFDSVPRGLLPVLRKLGGEPLDPDAYQTLTQWHLDRPAQNARCEVLSKAVMLNQDRIDAVAALNPILMMPAVFNMIGSASDAVHFNEAVSMIQSVCSDATDSALRESARELQGASTMSNWTAAWLRRADKLPSPPFEGDEDCVPITNGAAMEDAARRFKNCLATNCMTSFLTGRAAFVEYRPEPALAVLVSLTDGHWLVSGIHGRSNRPIDPELARRVEQKIVSFGPHIHLLSPENPTTGAVARRSFGSFTPFDFEWELMN